VTEKTLDLLQTFSIRKNAEKSIEIEN